MSDYVHKEEKLQQSKREGRKISDEETNFDQEPKKKEQPNEKKIQSKTEKNVKGKKECYGCKTFFEQGERLPHEDLFIELKNYNFPIKDQKNKWNLLKTICAYMNSKGGTIFIGVQDGEGEVIGITLTRKEQDDFKLFLQQLVQRIQPQIDLTDREQLCVQYVPIYSKQKFQGKYVIKIIVKQGDPAKLYCFGQKLQMIVNEKKNEEHEIVYSYKRHNMGGIITLKGLELVEQATKKGIKPIALAKTFHDDCNPEPHHPALQILKIGFRHIYDKMTRQKLQIWFEEYLKELNIEKYDITYDSKNDLLLIDFEDKQNYNKVLAFVQKNIEFLNIQLKNCSFVKKDIFLDCMLFQNEKAQQKNKNPPKNQGKVEEPQVKVEKIKVQKKNTQIQKQAQKEKPKPQEKSGKKQKIKRCFSLAFTHIEPRKKEELISFLDNNIVDVKKEFKEYDNTVEVFFASENDRDLFHQIAHGSTSKLLRYGFHEQIIFGTNEGIIEISNYNKPMWQNLKGFLKNLIGKELQGIDSEKVGGTYKLLLNLCNPEAACRWLDLLLKNKNLKQQFRIPNSEKGQAPKMKMKLLCGQLDEVLIL